MEIREGHFRHILLFYFRKGKNAAQAPRKLCGVYSDECLSERQCQKWFVCFRSGNFDVKDELNSTLCCQQRMRLKQAIEKKRPELINRRGVVFHYDNVKPHIRSVSEKYPTCVHISAFLRCFHILKQSNAYFGMFGIQLARRITLNRLDIVEPLSFERLFNFGNI